MERLRINLQLFAEGGAGGAGADGGAAGAGAGSSTGAKQSQDAAVTSKRANDNPLANVQYGRQEQAQDGAQQSDAGTENKQKATTEKFLMRI